MRVIAGEAKGRSLVAAKGGATRSATDRIREALFAILADAVEEARVLDLFAGAGTLGIEALSRGAAHVTFVERSREALAALRTNLARTGFDARAQVAAANVLSWLERDGGTHDLAFCDPPFTDAGLLEATLAHPGLVRALAPGALVVARARKKARPAVPAAATIVREREIGEETLMFLRYRAVGPEG